MTKKSVQMQQESLPPLLGNVLKSLFFIQIQKCTIFQSFPRKFMFALATFPKPLICGLQSGEACGIGLTILPLFDIVLARDDVKLSASYGLMGYFPEGLSVLRLLNKIKTRTVSEISSFFFFSKLTCSFLG